MAQSIHPPKEELEFQLQRKIPVKPTPKARAADIVSRWLSDHVYDENAGALRVTQDTESADPIYFDGESTDPLSRPGMLTGAIRDDNTFSSLKMSDKDRLLVDANLSLQEVDLEVHLDAENDSIAIGDRISGSLLKVEADGSINTNIAVSGILEDDSILIVGTSDGSLSGTRNIAKIEDDNLHVIDKTGNIIASQARDKTPSGLVTELFDDVELTYILSGNGKGQLGSAIYKAGGTTVATVELAYNSDNRLTRARRI